ncbi:hypothetical protein C6497_13115 [Candidatus Poribacteria bacterium]|nr:MAG: hypothetical protein C6497_13115 [Candidatus Poribacteria bacterium]
MKNDDVELIQLFLAGDEPAFTELVKKYQKPVHALAWRKISDFHIAEDITQDTFLKVYQRLHTLKDPNHFSGWLYVITTNLCATWLRRNKKHKEQLEKAEITMTQRDTYSQHIRDDRANSITQTQREVVRKLLGKLKESERTVMTLHYLGEMKIEEISRFLGVSVSTIKTRLMRARQRLRKEETMIREALEHFQISPNLTDNIMQEVARLKPTPSGNKPLLPWTVAASTAVLIALMLGIGNQHLARFQRPYSLDVQSEMSIELVEAHIVQNLMVEPVTRKQIGNANTVGKSNIPSTNPNEDLLAAAETNGEVKDVSNRQQEWIGYERSVMAGAESLLSTPEGDLYTLTTDGHLYILNNSGEVWKHVIDISSLGNDWWGAQPHLAKWNDTLYIVLTNELYASKDDGKTWNLLHSWIEEKDWYPSELVLTEQMFYIVFQEEAFRSEDQGRTWKDMSDEFRSKPYSFIAIKNTVFAAAGIGFYRRSIDKWERLEFPIPEKVYVTSVAGTENRLYVVTKLGPDIDFQAASDGQQRTWWIFRSTDLGNTWEDITPQNAWQVKGLHPDITLIAAGETLIAMEDGMICSIDGGDTWMSPLQPDSSPKMWFGLPGVAVNDQIIYVGSEDGFQRSTDGGKSWDDVDIPIRKKSTGYVNIDRPIVYNTDGKGPTVYAKSETSVVKTTNKGKSWETIQQEIPMTATIREEQPKITSITASDNGLYAKGERLSERVELFQISKDGNTLIPIPKAPTLHSHSLKRQLHILRNNPSAFPDKSFIEVLQEDSVGAVQFFKELADLVKWNVQGEFSLNQFIQIQQDLIKRGSNGAFAVSGDTFYLEYNFKLFRWIIGERDWYDTGVEETIGLTIRKVDGSFFPFPRSKPAGILNKKQLERYRILNNFKLAALGNTVYVGKRDGKLMASFDNGTNWIDFTLALPFPVIAFNEIVFAGTAVYVATDAGVATSESGKNWRALVDADERILVMEHLAVDENILYGVTEKSGIYRLKKGIWEQSVSEIPDSINSLAVDGKTFYVGTQNQGMLHYILE